MASKKKKPLFMKLARPKYWMQVCYKSDNKNDDWLESFDDYQTTVRTAAGFIANPAFSNVEFVLVLKGTVRKKGIPNTGELLASIDRSENVEGVKTIPIRDSIMHNKYMGNQVKPDKAANTIVYPSAFPQPKANGSLCENCKPNERQLKLLYKDYDD